MQRVRNCFRHLKVDRIFKCFHLALLANEPFHLAVETGRPRFAKLRKLNRLALVHLMNPIFVLNETYEQVTNRYSARREGPIR